MERTCEYVNKDPTIVGSFPQGRVFSVPVREVRSFSEEGPRLYICSTPIGNLSDVTHRLLEVLQSADVVAAEDTRQTRKLLTHFQIHPKELVSYHAHNYKERADDFLRWWREGKQIALVSDAGTPLISDPGAEAASLAIEQGIPVVPVPGPSAVLAAIVGSGLPAQPLTFVGFLAREKKEALQMLASVASTPGTLVFYEAPHRIAKTLAVLAQHFPLRPAVAARELTKRYETFVYADTTVELWEHFKSHEPRGEFVIVLGPAPTIVQTDEDLVQSLDQAMNEVLERMKSGMSHKEAVKEVSTRTGVRKKDLYQATLPSSDSSL